jgi:hypothetical protein
MPLDTYNYLGKKRREPTMATAAILSHIMQLRADSIFTTREVLQYGRRSAVDQCLYLLVKKNMIRRLASGVFIRDPHANPSVEEIARIKAAAFGLEIAPSQEPATLRPVEAIRCEPAQT